MARNRDDDKWDSVRDDVIDRSAELFAKHGFHATGVSELADAVGLTRGLLYYYIGSKEKLLGLIHSRVMENVLATAERALTTTGSAEDRLRVFGAELLEIFTQYPDHVWVFLHEFRSLTGEEATRFRVLRGRYEEMLRGILRDGNTAGEFEIPNTRLAALAWLGLHNYIYIWFNSSGEYSAAEIADYFASIFLNGVRPRTGESTPSAGRRVGRDASPARR